jgi:hypothetical protein
MELLIALVIMGLLVIGFSSIDLFSRFHVIASERRAKLQNEVSFGLEHMTKTVGAAIGDINEPPVIYNYPQLNIWIDTNLNGMKDAADSQIIYLYDIPAHQLWYKPTNNPQDDQIISQNVHFFDAAYNATNNYVVVSLGSCWDPLNITACGHPDNPAVVMNATIRMPSVSTH